MITEANRVQARQVFELTIRLIAAREEITIAEYALDALRNPTPSTVRALIAIGRGAPWLPSLIEAMSEVGIAAASEVLGGKDEWEKQNG